MPWFKVDDGFGDHPKVLAAGNAAIGLWTRCGAWCSKHPSAEGVVPEKIAKTYGKPREIRALCDAKLWRKVAGGYQMHDFHDYNPTGEQVAENRRQTAQRVARWRARNAVTNASPPAECNGVSNTAPTRPDPYMYSRSSTTSSLRVPVDEDGLNDLIAHWAKERGMP